MGLAFIYLALPTCLLVYVQKSDFRLINVFCVVIAVKNVLCLAQVVFSYFVLYSSKIPSWCIRPNLRICAAYCSDSQMELIV